MKRCRLVYRSVAAPAILEPDLLEEMVAHSKERNAASGITGLLVLSGRRFLQVLEGPVSFVNELLAKIMADPRHSRVELLAYDLVAMPLFFDWSMTVLRLDEVPASTRDIWIAKYDLEDGAMRIPDDPLTAYSLLLDARWLCTTKQPKR
jgi:hypothetical protein